MDKVKFGRALGQGARGAAKSLWDAAEAAAAPDPRPRAERPVSMPDAGSPPPARTSQGSSLREAAGHVLEAHRVVTETKAHARNVATQATKKAAKQAGRSMFAPVKKFSSVLWLEVTGVFFAVITLFLLQGVWRLRGAAHLSWSSPEAHKLMAYATICLLFAYFTVSSFVRARRRGKR